MDCDRSGRLLPVNRPSDGVNSKALRLPIGGLIYLAKGGSAVPYDKRWQPSTNIIEVDPVLATKNPPVYVTCYATCMCQCQGCVTSACQDCTDSCIIACTEYCTISCIESCTASCTEGCIMTCVGGASTSGCGEYCTDFGPL